MSRLLCDLTPAVREQAYKLIALCAEAGVPVMIITTLRTAEEQADAVARGVSWTLHSKHEAQPPDGLSHAIDVCPYSQFTLHGHNALQWDISDPAFQTIGKIGESIGLKWGVWLDGVHKDLGHFEYVEEKTT